MKLPNLSHQSVLKAFGETQRSARDDKDQGSTEALMLYGALLHLSEQLDQISALMKEQNAQSHRAV